MISNLKAIILAAGEGKRLYPKTKGNPKPLTHLLGLSLIERSILSAKTMGITDFIIVVGYKGSKIKDTLGDGSRYNVNISYIENPEWKRGNGVSLLKTKNFIKESFILMMSDHIFDPSIIKSLLKAKDGIYECIIAVDRTPKEYIDIEEATKVKLKGNQVVDIGKKIDDYQGVDCGLFLMTPAIFDALEGSIRRGDETLSGGIKVLIERKKVGYVDIKDTFWIDIDTPSDYNIAKKQLLKNLIKPTDGPISRFLNRPISLSISKYLVETHVTPNTITFISFLISIPAAYLFFKNTSYIYILLAGILTQISSIIDGVDGEIARLKYQQSKYGAWLDSCLDRYSDAIIIFGITHGYWIIYGNGELTWFIGTAALIGSFMNSYTAMKYDTFIETRKTNTLRIGRDIRLFIIMIGAIFNQLLFTLIILAIITNIESWRRLYIMRDISGF